MVPFWFIVIAVLWTGFFILEGFDFGVGMLHSVVGRDEAGRRAAINTIGPLWDGNEVWLIVAGAAMFAAFPGWYATMFSALYLALALLLAALIIRGVAFEYRGKRDAARWRRTWDVSLTVGSLLAPLLIGVGLGDLLHGLPINSAQDYTGSFWDLLQPYALFTGVTLVADLPAARGDVPVPENHRRHARAVPADRPHGGPVHRRRGRGLRRLDARDRPAAPSSSGRSSCWPSSPCWPRSGWSTSTATASPSPPPRSRSRPASLSIFVGLYPNVMVSSTNPAYNLTVHNTASNPYSLTAMTVVVVIFLPLVLAYQSWTYYVFRRRVSREQFVPGFRPPRPRRPRRARPGRHPGHPGASPTRPEGAKT